MAHHQTSQKLDIFPRSKDGLHLWDLEGREFSSSLARGAGRMRRICVGCVEEKGEKMARREVAGIQMNSTKNGWEVQLYIFSTM